MTNLLSQMCGCVVAQHPAFALINHILRVEGDVGHAELRMHVPVVHMAQPWKAEEVGHEERVMQEDALREHCQQEA